MAGIGRFQDGIVARRIVLNNQSDLLISVINPLSPALPAISYMMAGQMLTRCPQASFVGFLHAHQAVCENA